MGLYVLLNISQIVSLKLTYSLTDVEHTNITYCKCIPAALTLVHMGMFPCTPIEPSLAFDVNLLDLIRINMCYLAPNLSGWALTLEWFLHQRGYELGQRVTTFSASDHSSH